MKLIQHQAAWGKKWGKAAPFSTQTSYSPDTGEQNLAFLAHLGTYIYLKKIYKAELVKAVQTMSCEFSLVKNKLSNIDNKHFICGSASNSPTIVQDFSLHPLW